MGLTKTEWRALTPEQQAQYRAQQYAIDEKRRRDWEAERTRQDQIAAENERLERERLMAAYRDARYGDIVCVVVQGGAIRFGGQLRQFEPIALDLVKGERREFEFVCQERQYIKARGTTALSPDGNTLVLEFEGERLVLVNDGWERGRSYKPRPSTTYHNDPVTENVSVGVRLKPLPLRREPVSARPNQWTH